MLMKNFTGLLCAMELFPEKHSLICLYFPESRIVLAFDEWNLIHLWMSSTFVKMQSIAIFLISFEFYNKSVTTFLICSLLTMFLHRPKLFYLPCSYSISLLVCKPYIFPYHHLILLFNFSFVSTICPCSTIPLKPYPTCAPFPRPCNNLFECTSRKKKEWTQLKHRYIEYLLWLWWTREASILLGFLTSHSLQTIA